MQSESDFLALSQSRSVLDRNDLWALGLGLPLVACWLWFADLGGYPTNDDPFYGRPAQILADESRFQLVTQAGELAASSAAHAAFGGGLSWLIGFSYRTLFLVVIIQLWLAALALYVLAREAGRSRWFSLFWGSVFLANPLCFGHAFTFMTDAPAASWGVLAVFFFRRGLCGFTGAGQSNVWLLAGSVAVGVAFWMRQTHVLYCSFPVAGLCLMWYRGELSGKRCFRGVWTSVCPAAVAVILFESGWLVFGDGLIGQKGRLHVVAPEGFDWYQNAINIYGVGILMGFLVLPLLPLLLERLRMLKQINTQTDHGPPKIWKWSMLFGASIVVLWSMPLIVTQGRACLTSATGSVVANAHFGPIFLSDFEIPERWGDMGGVDWPNWVWASLTALAIVNLAALASCLVPSIQAWLSDQPQSRLHSAITFGLVTTAIPIVLVILSVSTGVLDRYWMMLLPILFALVPEIIVFSGRATRALATGLLFVQLCMSVVFARDFLTWNQRERTVKCILQGSLSWRICFLELGA